MLRGVRTMTTSSTSNQNVIFHWFRHGDLRLHDNPALVHSCQMAAARGNSGAVVIPVFCFDSNIFGSTATNHPSTGGLKCGVRRAQFLTECVADLRHNLMHQCGSPLLVAHGEPAQVFDDLIQKLASAKGSTVSIVCQEEVVSEEQNAVKSVQVVLKKHKPSGKVHTVWGSTMYDLKDLPFADGLDDMPDVFTPFRTKVEKKSEIRLPLAAPTKSKLPSLPQDTKEFAAVADLATFLPTLQDLGYTSDQIAEGQTMDPRGVMDFRGGERVALQRMKEYIWDKDLLKNYFDTRNGMLGADYSTKFSPWLAHGCLSPRKVAAECRRYEQERVSNKSTYWVVFELLWRDFCKFFALKHGDAIFYQGGTIGSDKQWNRYDKSIEAWKAGKTGYPLVDANMREMKATGFMSNRGRQNVASFLAIDLAQDWRVGGDWFETHLVDYDVYSNWVNWCAAAGMTGGRLNRFNIVKQSKDYDQHGEYVRHWLPELKDVPNQFVHEPWKMTQFQQAEYKVRLGVDYPNPIVSPSQARNGSENDNGGGGRGRGNDKQRRSNNSKQNKHQKYEMKSLKEGHYQIKG